MGMENLSMDKARSITKGMVLDECEKLDDLVNKVYEELYGNPLESTSILCNSCVFCEYSPDTKQNLETHLIDEHKKYLCLKCGKLFSKKAQLTLHQTRMHDSMFPKKNIKCSRCDKLYSNKHAMQRHFRFEHEGNKDRFDCQFCEYQATASNALQIHIKSIHERVKYSCKQCDYQGTQMSNLRTHIKVKHEDVVFSCNLCGK